MSHEFRMWKKYLYTVYMNHFTWAHAPLYLIGMIWLTACLSFFFFPIQPKKSYYRSPILILHTGYWPRTYQYVRRFTSMPTLVIYVLYTKYLFYDPELLSDVYTFKITKRLEPTYRFLSMKWKCARKQRDKQTYRYT